MSECPKSADDPAISSGICFKCGSTEHGAYSCRSKVKGFPFAKCFVCGEEGHLSRQCQKNLKGLYPDGGCCKHCGSINHKVKECPVITGKQGKKIDFCIRIPQCC
ncbi:unnamed protein product [Soboliphyme baturini]|uniref:CCHC-type domain-containing protein n=1 Tax=Soboliphyme baturini TaxID=241478 RepID=A0A183IRU8_9BILA|nr:unnamed protein product [Soboliphyme baturini]